MLTCEQCGSEYPRREGRGRQSPFCSDRCRMMHDRFRRRMRFLDRYHVVDTHKALCITCGSDQTLKGEVGGIAHL